MKKKKLLSVFLTATLAASVLSACGSTGSTSTANSDEVTTDAASAAISAANAEKGSSNSGEGGSSTRAVSEADMTPEEKEAVGAGLIKLDGTLPIIKDPTAFEAKYGKISSLIVTSADRTVPVKDLAMCKKWFEDTGVEFDWQEIPQEGAQEKINLMLASGQDLPDVFWNFGDGKSGNIVVQYADQDIFVPTEDMIKKYMPNEKRILDANSEYYKEIYAPDGHTYGFPYIEQMYGLVLTGGPMLINKTWLDELGLSVPTTVDEWVKCMEAFRDGGDLGD